MRSSTGPAIRSRLMYRSVMSDPGDSAHVNAPFDVTTKLGYLETIGRVSGRPRETEIWFAWEDGMIYLLSGGGLAKD